MEICHQYSAGAEILPGATGIPGVIRHGLDRSRQPVAFPSKLRCELLLLSCEGLKSKFAPDEGPDPIVDSLESFHREIPQVPEFDGREHGLPPSAEVNPGRR